MHIVCLISLMHIQELLDLKSDSLKIMNEYVQSETNGDISCHNQSPVSSQFNSNVSPDGVSSSGSVLPHGLPSGQDVILSVSCLSAQWTDVSAWLRSELDSIQSYDYFIVFV